jgi:hypothetical protein
MIASIEAAMAYFLAMFAAGWVFGPLRELVFLPLTGNPLLALVIEAPLMITAMTFAAPMAARWRRVPTTPVARFSMGLVALVLLLLAEDVTSRLLRDASLLAVLRGHSLGVQAVEAVLYAAFVAMPWLRRLDG